MSNLDYGLILEQALQIVQDYLTSFANRADFISLMQTAFGVAINETELSNLQRAWVVGDFSDLSPIEIRSASEINGSYGAYAATTDTIYIAHEFLDSYSGHLDAIADLLLEEVGHSIDVDLNTLDGEGDEGDIFARLVQEDSLSQEELQQLKTEDDSATVTLDGQTVVIEQSEQSLTTNIFLSEPYSGPGDDFGNAIRKTLDNSGSVDGFIISGYTRPLESSDDSAYLIKIDENGVVEWKDTYDFNSNKDRFHDVEVTSDGGYIACGSINHDSYSSRFYLVKIASDGKEEWRKTFGDTRSAAYDVAQTSDGGYILVGDQGLNSSWDIRLTKVDADGNEDWTKIYGDGNVGDRAHDVQVTSDGGFIITGVTGGYSTDSQIWVIKTYANGNIQWERKLGNPTPSSDPYWDWGWSVVETNKGDFVVAGNTWTGDERKHDVVLTKLNAQGTKIWQQLYGSSGNDFGYELTALENGGFAIIGEINFENSSNYRDTYLIITDSEGNEIISQNFGGPNHDRGFSIQAISDTSFVFTGDTILPGSSDLDLYFAQTDTNQSPIADANGPYQINEGDSLTLDGSVSSDIDNGIVLYEWDLDYDGSTFDIDLTTSDATVSKIFEDNFTGTIALRVTDAGGLTDIDTAELIVNNVAPTIDSISLDLASINEGQSVNVSGTFSDPAFDLETFTGSAIWSDGETTDLTISGGNYETSRTFLDDNPTGTPSDIFTVSITINDDDGASNTATSPEVTIYNVNPELDDGSSLSSNLVVEGDSVEIIGASYIDVGVNDSHTGSIDWGDGTVDNLSDLGTLNGSGTATGNHEYSSAGSYQVKLTVTDDDGGVTESELGNVVVAKKVDIDWKPGSNPSAMNFTGKGTIPVAILGAADFDVRNINVASIRADDEKRADEQEDGLLYGTGVGVKEKKNRTLQFSYENTNSDAYEDLVLHFDKVELGAIVHPNSAPFLNDNQIYLFGAVGDDAYFFGMQQEGDPIKIV